MPAACVSDSPLLNSERIEATFGNYGIEVLAATESKRIANLYSTKDGVRTTRTYAITRFVLPVDPRVREEHALVVSGRSLGNVFKSRGWKVEKRNIRIGSRILTPADKDIAALMRMPLPCEVAVHEYALIASRNRMPVRYAVITELHHPDYLTRGDLEEIYGRVPKSGK